MKKQMLALLALTVAVAMTACKNPADKAKEDLDRRLDEINKESERSVRESQEKYEAIQKMLTAGGQPGAIYLSSTLAKKDAEGIVQVTEPRLTIKQTGGVGADGKVAAIDVKASVYIGSVGGSLDQHIEISKAANTYINVGCELKPDDIKDLKEKKMQISGGMTAVSEKLFLCGKAPVKQIWVMATASEVIMSDVDYSLPRNASGLSLTAKVLTLKGKNRLQTTSKESVTPSAMFSAYLDLNVTEKVSGEGSLELVTVGASYKAPAPVEKK